MASAEEALRELLPLKLRCIRRELGISQMAMADLTGLPQSRISGYETGKWIPQLPILARMASALGTTVSDILKGVC